MANPSTAKEEGDWAIVSFKDPWHFPTCNGISPFSQGISRPSYDPALDRWCLLAEVTDTAFFFSARVIARDRDGKDFVVGFYPNNADAANLNLGQFHVGHTIALAYPKPHKFPDGLWGVRVDELDSCSLFPVGLNDLLQINSDLCAYIGPRGTPRKCQACGKHDKELITCGVCQLYSYCNPKCLRIGWRDKGHEKACQLLKDPDFKSLLFFCVGEGKERFRFPL
ncbi:Putative Zinc finger, MYND-type [Colletotrichum destructivum]|uniref:Zinc finger, MYND-type n=1 Tax=Colletotrichum destructivum TaxID=34406 RepID=A0AAX4J204_9PEZI|nr:Putative Zinc finger, MYND-type [Colletotrichum destructivum]